jgi:hypothetical protein
MRSEVVESTNLVVQQAQAFTIASIDDANVAMEWRNELKDRVKAIVEKIAPIKKTTFAAWKTVCAFEAEGTAPLNAAIALFDQKLVAFNQAEQVRLRREREQAEAEAREQQRIRREAELRACSERLMSAGLIEIGGDNVWAITDAGVAALENFEAYPPGSLDRDTLLSLKAARDQRRPATAAEVAQRTVHSQPSITAPSSGPAKPAMMGGGVRDNWQAELVDLLELVKAAAENPTAYLDLLQLNQRAADGRAKAAKDQLRIPGLRPVNRAGVARSARR